MKTEILKSLTPAFLLSLFLKRIIVMGDVMEKHVGIRGRYQSLLSGPVQW